MHDFMSITKKTTKRVEDLISQSNLVLSTSNKKRGFERVDSDKFYGFKSSALSFLGEIFGKNHNYYIFFEKQVLHPESDYVKIGREILIEVKKVIDKGWTSSVMLYQRKIFYVFEQLIEVIKVLLKVFGLKI